MNYSCLGLVLLGSPTPHVSPSPPPFHPRIEPGTSHGSMSEFWTAPLPLRAGVALTPRFLRHRFRSSAGDHRGVWTREEERAKRSGRNEEGGETKEENKIGLRSTGDFGSLPLF